MLCGEETLEVNFNGSKPASGASIKFNKGSVVGISNFKIGSKTILASSLSLEEAIEPSICVLKEGAAKEVGSKYECEVKARTKYNFYVLSRNENGTYNLIMDQNINSDGTLVGTVGVAKKGNNVYNLVEWISVEDYITAGGEDLSKDGGACERGDHCSTNEYGPITAISFLNLATISWTNVPQLNETYTDEGGVYGTITFTGRARLPYKRELSDKTEATEFLYDNLSGNAFGYWCTSSVSNSSFAVWEVSAFNYVGNSYEDGFFINYNYIGVRPVITIEI